MTSTDASAMSGFPISKTTSEIPEAMSIYINQLVYDLRRRGNDVIALSLGEAFFDIPLFDFRKLDLDKSYHYSDSQGIPGLRRKIATYYKDYYGASIDPDKELIITAGSKIGIFMCMRAVAEAGDEILIHEPAWVSYQEQARLINAVPRFIPYDAPVETFGDYLTPRTRLVIINNPNNPAGRIYERRELEMLAKTCGDRKVYVMVDEAYSDFVIDREFVSMASVVPDKRGVIIVNSLSKNMGISGWRVGYLVTHADLLPHLLKINQHLITCAPSILLYYLEKYFEKIVDITLPQVRQVVEKRERIRREMDRIGMHYLPGSSTFYFFVSIDNFPGTDMDLALALLVYHGIAVVPGSAYGDSTKRFVRISIGTESDERIVEALGIIRSMASANDFDRPGLHDSMSRLGLKMPTIPERTG
jgi:aspartate/methionine/tyrosine aminotransferase